MRKEKSEREGQGQIDVYGEKERWGRKERERRGIKRGREENRERWRKSESVGGMSCR